MIEIFYDIDQRSDAWRKVRCGIATASCFADIMAKGEGKMRRSYMNKLADERLYGEPMENYVNGDMQRGIDDEEEGRALYAFNSLEPLTRVGFVRNGRVGCSPDSFVGTSGILELKSAARHILMEAHRRDAFPPEHRAQCQGALWVCERDWVEIMLYCPKREPFRSKVGRDEPYIATLKSEVDRFNEELAEVVDAFKRRYGNPVPPDFDAGAEPHGEAPEIAAAERAHG